MIAVTGATGLLGRHLIQALADEKLEAIGIYRQRNGNIPDHWRQADMLDPVALLDSLKDVDTVIHAAAMVSFNPRARKKMIETNVRGTAHVVNACLKAGVKNLIHISSVAALGRKSGTISSEETPWTGAEITDYAESKYLAELEAYRGVEEGLSVSIVNPSVILSGMQPLRSSTAILDYVWKENRFYTSGSLNYVDARDVCAAVLKLYHHPTPGERYILSAGSVGFKDFFALVARRFNKRAPQLAATPLMTWLAGVAGELGGMLLNREPVVTRQSAAMACRSMSYDNQKAKERLNLSFRSLEATLDWCCADYLRNVNPNK